MTALDLRCFFSGMMLHMINYNVSCFLGKFDSTTVTWKLSGSYGQIGMTFLFWCQESADSSLKDGPI